MQIYCGQTRSTCPYLLPLPAAAPLLLLPPAAAARPARKVAEKIVREQAVVAARISGADPSMHIILRPNTDGDEATVTSADVVAGRGYLHKIDAVLVPKSTLAYLDSFTADSDKKHKKNATVSEAFGKNATANSTADAKAIADANATADSNGTAASNGTSSSKNATTSGAAGLAVASVLGAPVLLAALLLL